MMHHVVTGFVFLTLGITTLSFPGLFERFYQLGLSEPSARALIQSLVGGTEIALGIGLIWARRFGFDIPTLLRFCALILTTIAAFRVATMIGWRAISGVGAVEVSLEALAANWLGAKAKLYQQETAT